MGTTSLFVYGTLRSEGLMHALLGDLRFLGRATFQGLLWDVGDFPGVTDSSRCEDRVHGEVYEVPDDVADEVFDRLDRYEGSGFERARREVTLDGGEHCQATLYLFKGSTAAARHVESGDYVADLNARGRAVPRG